MSSDERRLTPRKACAIPIQFHVPVEQLAHAAGDGPVTDSESFSARGAGLSLSPIAGESINFSERGICFTSFEGLRVGDPLEMYFTLPRELTGRNPEPVHCSARGVHVKNMEGVAGKITVGATIERYEPLSIARTWDN
jgi:hypothetical protein